MLSYSTEFAPPQMRYSIVKFHSTYGGRFYQVRMFRGWIRRWLKDEDGNVLSFPTHEAARAYMEKVAPTAKPQAAEEEVPPPD